MHVYMREREEVRSLIRNGVFSASGTSIDRDATAVARRHANATTTSIIGTAEFSTGRVSPGLRLCFVVSNTGCELITTAQCGLETVEGGILDSDGFS